MTGTKQFFCFALTVLFLVLLLCPFRALAADTIDPDAEASLKIIYQYTGTPVPNAEFEIFRAADVDKNAVFTLAPRFAKYGVSLSNNTAEEWNSAAGTLAAYAQADGILPDLSGTTDSKGELYFSGLKPGLYLVTGRKCLSGGYSYTTRPVLVCLPGLDAEHGSWIYDVCEYPKSRRDSIDYPPETPDTVERAVLKIWDDNGGQESRPASVAVQLFADGVPYGEPVKLTPENSWSHKWHSLPERDSHGSKIVWTVIEKDFTGYIVNISQKGITFTITNTLPGLGGPDEPPEPPVPSSPPEPPVPSEPPQWPGLPHTGGPEIPVLPQTGLLWWPVPVLLCAGLLFIAIGVSRRKRGAK